VVYWDFQFGVSIQICKTTSGFPHDNMKCVDHPVNLLNLH